LPRPADWENHIMTTDAVILLAAFIGFFVLWIFVLPRMGLG
jgi:hypothetical protein